MANIDKYKKALLVDEIATIEAMTGEYMQRYGYERMTDTTAAFHKALLDEARDRSNQARTEAWRELEHTNFRDFALRCQLPPRRVLGVGTLAYAASRERARSSSK